MLDMLTHLNCSCDRQLKILVVDDIRNNLDILSFVLSPHYLVLTADCATAAIEIVHSEQPDLVLMDIMMPGMSGTEACRVLLEDHTTNQIPVILVSAKATAQDLREGLDAGAVDYIKKPFNTVEILARTKVALRLKQAQDQLRKLATFDCMTAVYNHTFFVEQLKKEVASAIRYDTNFVFMMLDIDLFKQVNDTHGHLVGDDVLQGLATLLRDSIRSSDIIGRYGGEEFTILVKEIDLAQAQLFAVKLCEKVASSEFPCHGQTKSIKITVSIGIAAFSSRDAVSFLELIERADQALYTAKENGRNQVVFNQEGQMQVLPAPQKV